LSKSSDVESDRSQFRMTDATPIFTKRRDGTQGDTD